MKKNKEIDYESPEMQLRYKNCLMAIDGIISIIEIVGKNSPDAMFVLGSVMGATLYRHIEKQHLPEVLDKLREQALSDYTDFENEEKLDNVSTSVGH